MVALVEGSQRVAIHRTYLLSDGCGKAAVEPTKMMLGQAKGGAVRLGTEDGPLVVAEGIETALSIRCGFLTGPATVWAGLSTSGLRGLLLPSVPGQLIIAADGDTAGHSAAAWLAARARASGWQVSLLSAPEGRDWNDMLCREVRR